MDRFNVWGAPVQHCEMSSFSFIVLIFHMAAPSADTCHKLRLNWAGSQRGDGPCTRLARRRFNGADGAVY